MKIINVQATAAVGVKFPDEPLRSVHSGNYFVPLMVSTQAIAEGDELVCYWGGGAPQSAAEALAETSLPQRAESSKKNNPHDTLKDAERGACVGTYVRAYFLWRT